MKKRDKNLENLKKKTKIVKNTRTKNSNMNRNMETVPKTHQQTQNATQTTQRNARQIATTTQKKR